MNKLLKATGGLLLTLALLLSMSVAAFAYTPLDLTKTGSITVSPASGQSIGTKLTLYQVADVTVDDADQKYVLTEEFKASGVDLTDLDDAETLAEELSAYVTARDLSGTVAAVGANGSVTFGELPLGLYLIIQSETQEGESVVNPFLVSVPVLDSNEQWVYDVDASPKAQTYELTDVTVKKLWNDGGSASRPSAITVRLYDGSDLLDTVTLNSANSWSYTWTDLEKSDGYRVVEASVSGYTATYRQIGYYTFIITNTGGSTPTATTTPTTTSSGGSSATPSTLVKTGQLNWPIPLLAGGGIALFAIGWALVFLKRDGNA